MRVRQLALVIGVITVAAATPARADFALAMGLKWTPITYTKPISVTAGPKAVDLGNWQQTSLDNYLGIFFLNGRMGFQLGLDIGYGSVKNDSVTGMTTTSAEQTFTQFGFSLGAKFYLTQPRKERVSPYVFVDFFKYFASVSTSDQMVTNDQASFIAGLVSPLGFDAALGAEYFFTPAFSLGAEVLGLRFAYSEGDFTTTGGFGGDTKMTESHKFLTLYTGISLNYRFEFQSTVRVREPSGGTPDESEEAPSPRSHRRRPPSESPPPETRPSEPPPAAESVD